jgi:hypothetical protein
MFGTTAYTRCPVAPWLTHPIALFARCHAQISSHVVAVEIAHFRANWQFGGPCEVANPVAVFAWARAGVSLPTHPPCLPRDKALQKGHSNLSVIDRGSSASFAFARVGFIRRGRCRRLIRECSGVLDSSDRKAGRWAPSESPVSTIYGDAPRGHCRLHISLLAQHPPFLYCQSAVVAASLHTNSGLCTPGLDYRCGI